MILALSMGDESNPEQGELTDLGTGRGLIAQLQGLIATLHALIGDLRASLEAKEAENAELRRALVGPKSERQRREPSSRAPARALTEAEKAKRHEKTQAKRAANRAKRKKDLESVQVEHAAPEQCPACAGPGPFTPLSPELSQEIEYVEERLQRLVHVLGRSRNTKHAPEGITAARAL